MEWVGLNEMVNKKARYHREELTKPVMVIATGETVLNIIIITCLYKLNYI